MSKIQIKNTQIKSLSLKNEQIANDAEIDLSKIAGGVNLENRVTDLENDAFVTREIPSGSIDGTNVTFTLANAPVSGSEQVFLNGLLQDPGLGNSYTISGSVITFATAPLAGDEIYVSYATGTYLVAPGGSGSSFSGDYNDLTNKPALFSGAYADLTGKPSLFSGAYADLTGKPSLFSGAYADLTGKPTLATVATSGSYNDLTDKPAASSVARVYTVGKDAATIQGCINLCTSPTLSNAYVILIPPGTYTENLTFKKQCHLQGMCNPDDTSTVKITGNHTYAGTDINAVNNRITFANIVWVNNSTTVATFALTATTTTQLNFSGCFFQNTVTDTTSKIFDIGTNVRAYLKNCVSRMGGAAGTGGTHFVISGGTLYCMYGVDVDGGTRILDMTTAGYAQLTNSIFACSGTDAIRVVANGLVAAGYCAFTNSAATGNGVNLLGAGASMLASWCSFDIQNSATTYVVTGVAGTSFVQTSNNYAHIAGVLTRNVKIKNTVTLLNYTTALTASA